MLSQVPGGPDGEESACSAEDTGSIPGLERSPGGGHGNPLQYSCLEPHGQRSLRATVHGVAKSQTRLRDPFPQASGTLRRTMEKTTSSSIQPWAEHCGCIPVAVLLSGKEGRLFYWGQRAAFSSIHLLQSRQCESRAWRVPAPKAPSAPLQHPPLLHAGCSFHGNSASPRF